MSANKFKVGDKVKVRKGLVADKFYGDMYCNSLMASIGGTVFTINCVKSDFYRVEEYNFCWSDEMLELAEKTIDSLCAGDFVGRESHMRKILAVVDGCYLLSHAGKYTHAFAWYTVNELKEGGYNFIELDSSEPTIEIDGKKYKKVDVEEAIKDLEQIN